jgi:hypothetical protein
MQARVATAALALITGVALAGRPAAAQTPAAEPGAQSLPAVSPVATETRPPVGIVPPPGVAGPVVSLTGCVKRMDKIETKHPLDQPVSTFFVLEHAADLQVVAVDRGQQAPSTTVLDGRTTYGLISASQSVPLEHHISHRVEVTGSFRSPAGLGPTVGLSLDNPNVLVTMIVRSLKMLDGTCAGKP